MNFEFSDEAIAVRDMVRKMLTEEDAIGRTRDVALTNGTHDRKLWELMGELGLLGAAIPESLGGSGMGAETCCMIAQEIGRACASVPYQTSAIMAVQALLLFGTEEQKAKFLPGLSSGELVLTVAHAEGAGNPDRMNIAAQVVDGRLTGTKWPVAEAEYAKSAIVLARDGDDVNFFLADLSAPGVERSRLKSLDPAKNMMRVSFTDVRVQPLQADPESLAKFYDIAAIFTAFEQIGCAEASLSMAIDYAKNRYAFGRAIGSFQALKQKLADCYIALELARSNAYSATWTLENRDGRELTAAAAAARVSASHAADICSKENIQVHGGIGVTWESQCHFYLRRAQMLNLALGAPTFWLDRLSGAILHTDHRG